MTWELLLLPFYDLSKFKIMFEENKQKYHVLFKFMR